MTSVKLSVQVLPPPAHASVQRGGRLPFAVPAAPPVHKFLHKADTATTIGQLWLEIEESYKNNYLNQSQWGDFVIKKLQDEEFNDLARHFLLSDIVTDASKITIIYVIQERVNRLSSVPFTSYLRPAGYLPPANRLTGAPPEPSSQRYQTSDINQDEPVISVEPEDAVPAARPVGILRPSDWSPNERSERGGAKKPDEIAQDSALGHDMEDISEVDATVEQRPAKRRMQSSSRTTFLKPSLPQVSKPQQPKAFQSQRKDNDPRQRQSDEPHHSHLPASQSPPAQAHPVTSSQPRPASSPYLPSLEHPVSANHSPLCTLTPPSDQAPANEKSSGESLIRETERPIAEGAKQATTWRVSEGTLQAQQRQQEKDLRLKKDIRDLEASARRKRSKASSQQIQDYAARLRAKATDAQSTQTSCASQPRVVIDQIDPKLKQIKKPTTPSSASKPLHRSAPSDRTPFTQASQLFQARKHTGPVQSSFTAGKLTSSATPATRVARAGHELLSSQTTSSITDNEVVASSPGVGSSKDATRILMMSRGRRGTPASNSTGSKAACAAAKASRPGATHGVNARLGKGKQTAIQSVKASKAPGSSKASLGAPLTPGDIGSASSAQSAPQAQSNTWTPPPFPSSQPRPMTQRAAEPEKQQSNLGAASSGSSMKGSVGPPRPRPMTGREILQNLGNPGKIHPDAKLRYINQSPYLSSSSSSEDDDDDDDERLMQPTLRPQRSDDCSDGTRKRSGSVDGSATVYKKPKVEAGSAEADGRRSRLSEPPPKGLGGRLIDGVKSMLFASPAWACED